MNPSDLIRIAQHLAAGGVGDGRGRPRQADLCRAVSAAYYAIFHALAQCGADLLAGATPASRNRTAWEQTYRALEHGHARNQCNNSSVVTGRFPPAIQDFARQFVLMQRLRHYADYSPAPALHWDRVIRCVAETERVIAQFNAAPTRDRRAFAIYALLRVRRE